MAKVIAQVGDLVALTLLARYLSKSDYGSLAYALSLVMVFKAMALFELPDTLSRFIPMFREEGQLDKAAGSIRFGLLMVGVVGAVMAALLAIGVKLTGQTLAGDALTETLVLICALSIPIDALDILITALFGTLGRTGPIVVRQAIFGPILRVGVIVVLIMRDASVVAMAWSYVAVGVILVAAYLAVFLVVTGASEVGKVRRPSWPVRPLLGFSTPLLASTAVWLLMESSDAVLIGYFHNTKEVANFRAVMPYAALNKGVLLTFGLLFTPIAAAAFANQRQKEIHELYWQSALWVTVLTFPILLLTFSFSKATTVGLLGEEYRGSAGIMALLAIGYYFHAALGFNGLTLKIYGRVAYSVTVDIAAAVFCTALNLLLIPPYGAVGAAIAICTSLILHNIFKQMGMWRYTGVAALSYMRTYAGLMAVAVLLYLWARWYTVSLPLACAVTAVVSLGVLVIHRNQLALGTTFPELERIAARLRPAESRRRAPVGIGRMRHSSVTRPIAALAPEAGILQRHRSDAGVYVAVLTNGSVFRLGRSPSGRQAVEREYAALTQLHHDARLAAWLHYLPEVRSFGSLGRWIYLEQSSVGEANATQLLTSGAAWPSVVQAGAEAIAPLHCQTGDTVTVDARTLSTWVGDRAARVASVLPGARRRQGVVAAAALAEDCLTGCRIEVGWTHGDYWIGNLVLDQRRQIAGIIDWEGAAANEPIACDLLYLILYSWCIQHRADVGGVIRAGLAEPTRWDPVIQAMVESLLPDLGDVNLRRGLLAACWLRVLSTNLTQSQTYARHPVWIRRNIDVVIRGVDSLAWAA